MTKKEILALKAGRELDKAVAEAIGEIYPKTSIGWQQPAPVSTDISVAWLVVEKMEELGWGFTLETSNKVARCFPLSHDKPSSDWVRGEIISEAISKAALLAKLAI